MRDRSYEKLKEKASRVSQDEIDSIREDARNAAEALANPFVISYFSTVKKDILDIHAKQLVYDAEEHHNLPNGVKVIKFPSKSEYLVLAGKYRLSEQFIQDMEQAVAIGKELEERIKSETVEVVE